MLAIAFGGLIYGSRAQQNPLQRRRDPSLVYVVSFIDFAGGSAAATEGAKDIQQYVQDTRKDPGNMRCEALSQLNRTNHLVVIEVWQNQDAFEKHESAEHTKAFRAKIQPILGAPFDERLHSLVQ